ncbi:MULTISPECIES: hypothetical protein [Enterococcus]|uniref:HEAT repeat domain-containing protein n=1 Tax=Candidatus Enterococcus murrayae TaxID=2815321 RepID=A0ABS3HI45_9ENTE|nr:hypothetical protein [Enterococcus sp. MJM16]MBO0452672.1 hypothetical protein [Enterococcus sp. MJM16]
MQLGSIEELIIFPLSVEQCHADWKIAQNICVELSNDSDERVRANSALGFAYIARKKGKIEKHIVKPILLGLLKNSSDRWARVVDSIQDIDSYMNWQRLLSD